MKRLSALLMLTFLAAGCAGDGEDAIAAATAAEGSETREVPASTTTSAAPSTTAASEPVTSSTAVADASSALVGCGNPVPVGVTNITLTSGGIERTYRRFVPRSYDGTTSLPVVLNFHGLTGTAAGQALSSGLEVVADRENFIAVHPQGTKNSGGLTFFEFGLGDSGVDDVGFAADVLDHLATELCVDDTRFYSMGHSNGGYLSSRLACDLADRLAAVATVSATNHPDDCRPADSIPLLAFHATGDDVVPFDGGPTALLGGQRPSEIENAPAGMVALIEVLGLEISDEVGQWAETNGCDGQSAATGAEGETLISYVGCDAPVEFHVIDGGDHSWPGAGGRPGLDATELAWEFFSEHTR